MIKVLHIISDTNIGGAGTLLLNYLHSHDRSSFSVSVALPRSSKLIEYIMPFGVRVFETDCIRDKSFDLPAIRKLTRLIREDDPDIVHTHGALSGRIAGKHCGKSVVFSRLSAFPSSPVWHRFPGKAVYKFINEHYADRIIAVNHICRDDLISCGVSASRIDVILNGSKKIKKIDDRQREKLRMEYGFAPGDFVAGIVARIEPYKGQMYIVEAAKILRDMGKDIKFIIAGTGTYEQEVKKRADYLGLGGIIKFPGFISDAGLFMNVLDVQINASYVEATSMSLIEGMSIGLPAIASNESGNPWVIQDGVNGLLFDSRDSGSLAAKILQLHDDPELKGTLSAGALEIYEKKFTCEIFARNTEAVYIKCAKPEKQQLVN